MTLMLFSILFPKANNYKNQVYLKEDIHLHHPNQLLIKFKNNIIPINPTKDDILYFLKNININYLIENEISGIVPLFNPKHALNTQVYNKLELANVYKLSFSNEIENIDEIIMEFMNTDSFEYVEPNYAGSSGGNRLDVNDPLFYEQWSLNNSGIYPIEHPGIPDADIDMEEAWDIENGSDEIIIGILDSGFNLNHPDFSGRIWKNQNEIPNNNLDDDGNGYVDDYNGWNFAYDNNYPQDDLGHGTNIATIIGANSNNEYGYAGIDWNCKIMNVKILDSNNFGYYDWWISAIYYAVNNGVNLLNMSVGGADYSQSMADVVEYAHGNNVITVACMMNTNTSDIYWPAGYEHTIAVGATDTDDTRCMPFFWGGGSNFGNHIDFVAPGNYIWGYHPTNNNNSWYWGGTSQATPHVVGLISLLIAQDETRTIGDIKLILQETSEDQIGSIGEDLEGWDMYYGFGRINAYKALSYDIAGDINGDDVINVTDIILLMDTILDANSEYEQTVDLNYDGSINIFDILVLLNIILNNQ